MNRLNGWVAVTTLASHWEFESLLSVRSWHVLLVQTWVFFSFLPQSTNILHRFSDPTSSPLWGWGSVVCGPAVNPTFTQETLWPRLGLGLKKGLGRWMDRKYAYHFHHCQINDQNVSNNTKMLRATAEGKSLDDFLWRAAVCLHFGLQKFQTTPASDPPSSPASLLQYLVFCNNLSIKCKS